MTISMIYSLFGSENEAQAALEKLLEVKMVACGNIFPCSSHFFWEGKSQNEKEWVLIVKTSQKMKPIAMETIERIHPYRIPAIISWDVITNSAYANWVEEVVTSQ